MVAEGSILPAMVGFIALFVIVFVRFASLYLSDRTGTKKGISMKNTTRFPKLFGFCVLETTWAIGVEVAAGALPA